MKPIPSLLLTLALSLPLALGLTLGVTGCGQPANMAAHLAAHLAAQMEDAAAAQEQPPPATFAHAERDILASIEENNIAMKVKFVRFLRWGRHHEFSPAHRQAMEKFGWNIYLPPNVLHSDKKIPPVALAQEAWSRYWFPTHPDKYKDHAILYCFGEDGTLIAHFPIEPAGPLGAGRWMDRIPTNLNFTP